MKKFYFSTNSTDKTKALACVECEAECDAVSLLREALPPETQITPRKNKPRRADFRKELSDIRIAWAEQPERIATGAGRPKGTCKPVELRRVSHTLTVLPKTKANLLKLSRGEAGKKLDELYG